MISTDTIINSYLLSLKILPTLKGYKYIRECIKMVMNDGVFISFKRTVYPLIAMNYNTTSASVERGISNAIESAWLNADVDTLFNEFGYTIQPNRGKPTNKEFICLAADKIKHKITELLYCQTSGS